MAAQVTISAPVSDIDITLTPIRSTDIRPTMELLVPGKGIINVAHVVIDGLDVLVTNNPHDVDVDLPAHVFNLFDECRLVDSTF